MPNQRSRRVVVAYLVDERIHHGQQFRIFPFGRADDAGTPRQSPVQKYPARATGLAAVPALGWLREAFGHVACLSGPQRTLLHTEVGRLQPTQVKAVPLSRRLRVLLRHIPELVEQEGVGGL